MGLKAAESKPVRDANPWGIGWKILGVTTDQ
jgi:hypothetical protein